MRLSKRGEYGLRAMIDIAAASLEQASAVNNPTGVLVPLRDIAGRQQIPPKFLEQILLALKNAGLLQSKMGLGGGYHLARPAGAITLGQIIRILDGPLAPIRCVSQMAYEPCTCPDEENCGLRMVMGDVRNALAAILDHTTLADVLNRVEATRALGTHSR